MNKTSQFFFHTNISPCDGLVVSGYSKGLPDKSLKTYLSGAINSYMKFKEMYIVDKTTGEFTGKDGWVFIVLKYD